MCVAVCVFAWPALKDGGGRGGWGVQRIWKEAEYRANSLERAEAGLGDTLWTARVRKDKSLDGKSNS